ncbi:MAG: hypothetical protein K0S61_4290 [Anaerocolumna sp.]|nr:hypothetical protein [Anaerocolumna sp.]
MSNTVRKFMPDDIWNLGRSESWFSDMAKNGLHLRKVGIQFALFDKGEPKKTKYRMDIISPMPTEEQLEIYKESGWQLVTNLKELYIFSSPEEADYPELHTDPMEQSYTLTALNRQLRIQVIVFTAFMVLFLGMMLSMFFLERTPTLAMMEAPGIQRPLLMFVEIYVFYTVIRNYMTLRRLKKSLSEGKPIDHRVNWRKPRLINGFIGAFFILAAFLTVCLPFAGIALSKTYTIPETSVNLPIVRLVDIEHNYDLKREVVYHSRGVDWGNRVSYDWSLLAPVQYAVNEHGIIKNMMWDDNSGSYSPSIETHYYQLTFSSMAISLLQDLVERYVNDFDPKVIIQEVNHTFFDKLYVVEDGIRKQIFAYSGNEVIYVDYFGSKNAEDIIALLPEAFSIYEK